MLLIPTTTLKNWLLRNDNHRCVDQSKQIRVSSLSSTCSQTFPTYCCHNNNILIMDGGVSSYLLQLLQESTKQTDFPHRSLWSSSLLLTEGGRKLIQQGHEDWLQAGSDILTTVTYQCHYGGGEGQNYTSTLILPTPVSDQHEMTKMFQCGIQLARTAIQSYHTNNDASKESSSTTAQQGNNNNSNNNVNKNYVVASSGCYGAALANGAEYTGIYPNVTYEEIMTFHEQKLNILWKEQADGIAIETIPSLMECRAVCQVLCKTPQSKKSGITNETVMDGDNNDVTSGSSINSSSVTNTADVDRTIDTNRDMKACWISLACQNDKQLNDGNTVLDALATIRSMDPDAKHVHAIGFNCFDSIHMLSLVQTLTLDMVTNGPRRGIVLYPNSGEEWDTSNEAYKEGTGCTSSNEFAKRLYDAIGVIRTTWWEQKSDEEKISKTSTTATQHCDYPDSMPNLILGGCCRTSPMTITTLRLLVDEKQPD